MKLGQLCVWKGRIFHRKQFILQNPTNELHVFVCRRYK